MMMILRKNEVVTGLLSLIYQTIEFATAFRCRSLSLFLFVAHCQVQKTLLACLVKNLKPF